MRVHWIVSILSTLVCMGLLLIIMGQYQVMTILHRGGEKLKMESERLETQHINEDLFKATLEKLLAQGKKAVEDLEATVAELRPKMEKKTTENYACQEEKKTKTDELSNMEKEHIETEAKCNAESDAWNQEINTLKAELTAYRPICDHVKKNPLALKLCDAKTS